MADYKKTLNLPDTPFPMRGDLAKREIVIPAQARMREIVIPAQAGIQVERPAGSPPARG